MGIKEALKNERDFAHLMLSVSERRALAKLAPETSYVMGIAIPTNRPKKQVRVKRKYRS